MFILFVKKICGYIRIYVFVDCYCWGVLDNVVFLVFINLDYILIVYDEILLVMFLYMVFVIESLEVIMIIVIIFFMFDLNLSNYF